MAPQDRRDELPRGTVTLLFTDIEGSTNALRALGPAYSQALSRHRALVRSACERYDGREMDTQGDAFLVVFGRASDAVTAAADAQRALAAEPWPDGVALRVRMGIHTGEPELGDEGYVGIDLHLAARICAAANGGQVLLSRATRDLVGDEPLPGGSVRDLGEHRLKDFELPQRLYQLEGPGLEAEFAPPRTGSTVRLPLPSNRLVGRERELAELRELVGRPDVRVVTLTGPGGTGKSRLALEHAWEAVERFTDGVVLVRLATVSDPELVPSAIAAALGIREPGSRPLLDAVGDHLAERELLLVVDNVEHVIEAAPLLALLFERAPKLRILATSRLPLRLRGEHVVDVEPLPQEDAASLFAERARAADRRFDLDAEAETVAEICRRLDGLPLAIELAAARIAVLTPRVLLERLGLALLTGGAADLPERHRTLAATFEWSYELLTPSQRDLHIALSVFTGGCTLEAVEAVCGADGVLDDLSALLSGGLLRREDMGGEPRFRMLQPIQEFAAAKLEASVLGDEVRERYALWATALAEEADVELGGPDQAVWLDRLEVELANIRAALEWSVANARSDLVLRIASALGRFWRAHGHMTEAREWLAAGLAAREATEPSLRARALWTAARQAMAQKDRAAAVPLLEEALELFRTLGQGRDEVFALSELGFAALTDGDLDRAEALCSSAVETARLLGDDRAVSGAVSQLAAVRGVRGDHAGALELHEEAVSLRRRLGDRMLVTNALHNLGIASLLADDVERAESAFREALTYARDLGDSLHTAGALCGLGQAALLAGAHDGATERLLAALSIYDELNDNHGRGECVDGLAAIAAASGDPEEAARLWGAADALLGPGAPDRDPIELALLERFRPGVEVELGPAAFGELSDAGASLTAAEILAAKVAATSLSRTSLSQ
jgi:predicted ATPase/class 3 adenylate cyclase